MSDHAAQQNNNNNPSQWGIGEPNTPYDLNEDNSAKDPIAFRDALMLDDDKRPEIEKEKDLAMALLGEDVGKFQECLKDLIGKVSVYFSIVCSILFTLFYISYSYRNDR